MTRLRSVVALAIGTTGCAYYNAMWSAEQHAKAAESLEQRGQVSEARAEWTAAATKAQAVIVHHPQSRWVPDAVVLQAEALARAGACQDAAEPIARAQAQVQDAVRRERVDLAAAECAIADRQTELADASLGPVLTSRNTDRRSRAEFLAGQAALLRSDYAAAVDHFQRSREPAASDALRGAQQRAALARVRQPADLTPIIAELSGSQATELIDLLTRVSAAQQTPAARFHAAELARDSLLAPNLAAQMFLDLAAGDTASLYAPKALIAALALAPAKHDSIVGVLDSRYASSPYTRALHGDASVAYAAAEDSLARDEGMPTARPRIAPSDLRFGAPSPGRRGPRL
jgi:hypothetical protein